MQSCVDVNNELKTQRIDQNKSRDRGQLTAGQKGGGEVWEEREGGEEGVEEGVEEIGGKKLNNIIT